MPSGSWRAWAWTGSGTSRLLGHAVFPSGFRLQVGPMTQGYHAQPLPCCTGIKLRRDAAHPDAPPVHRRLRFELRAAGRTVEAAGPAGAGTQAVVVALARLWLAAAAKSPD